MIKHNSDALVITDFLEVTVVGWCIYFYALQWPVLNIDCDFTSVQEVLIAGQFLAKQDLV